MAVSYGSLYLDYVGKPVIPDIEKKEERSVHYSSGNHCSVDMYGFAVKFQCQILSAGNGGGPSVYWLLHEKL